MVFDLSLSWSARQLVRCAAGRLPVLVVSCLQSVALVVQWSACFAKSVRTMNVLLALHSRESPRYLSRGAGEKNVHPG